MYRFCGFGIVVRSALLRMGCSVLDLGNCVENLVDAEAENNFLSIDVSWETLGKVRVSKT